MRLLKYVVTIALVVLAFGLLIRAQNDHASDQMEAERVRLTDVVTVVR